MATKVTMPQMGFDMTEGKVARWLKKVGDPVKHGEAVVEIETDKVNIESEALTDGMLREILVTEGATVPVGSLIGIIGAPDEDLSALKAEAGVAAPAAAAAVPQAAVAAVAASAAAATTAPAVVEDNGRIKASPLAKRMAQEKGVDLKHIAGSGPGG
ncbi:MAG TPA: biotin/lipoyl-containing protein, partial [Anaerolineae bacterium]